MTITEFNNLCKTFCIVAGIKNEHVLVAIDDHATNKLKEHPGLNLVAVIPTFEMDGLIDQETETRSTMLFVLEKAYRGQTDVEELTQYQKCENAIKKIREYVSEQQSEGCSPFKNYEVKETIISPEYMIFSDYNGWSMTLVF